MPVGLRNWQDSFETGASAFGSRTPEQGGGGRVYRQSNGNGGPTGLVDLAQGHVRGTGSAPAAFSVARARYKEQGGIMFAHMHFAGSGGSNRVSSSVFLRKIRTVETAEEALDLEGFTSATHYQVQHFSDGNVQLIRMVNSAPVTLVNSTNGAWSRGTNVPFKWEARVEGARIRAWLDDVLVIDHTDASPINARGYVAFGGGGGSTDSTIDITEVDAYDVLPTVATVI